MRFYFGKKCSLPLSHVTRPCITCTNAYEKPIEQIIFIKHINAAVYWSLITGRLQLRDHWTELQSIRHVGRRHPSRHLRLWRTGIPCCVCVCVRTRCDKCKISNRWCCVLDTLEMVSLSSSPWRARGLDSLYTETRLDTTSAGDDGHCLSVPCRTVGLYRNKRRRLVGRESVARWLDVSREVKCVFLQLGEGDGLMLQVVQQYLNLCHDVMAPDVRGQRDVSFITLCLRGSQQGGTKHCGQIMQRHLIHRLLLCHPLQVFQQGEERDEIWVR